MTLSVTHATEQASPLRGLLPLWVGAGVYALLLLAGNRLLNDPDTMWQITVGQWIIDHRAVPETDVYSFTMRGQPWISTQWLAQVLYAGAYAIFGWSGAETLGYSAMEAVSGAGHDAVYMARLAPAGMIFVPCKDGISHNEIEDANKADIGAGAQILLQAMVEKANS